MEGLAEKTEEHGQRGHKGLNEVLGDHSRGQLILPGGGWSGT